MFRFSFKLLTFHDFHCMLLNPTGELATELTT